MSPVKAWNGLGLGLARCEPVTLAVTLFAGISTEVVFDKLAVDEDVVDVRRFFASSRGT